MHQGINLPWYPLRQFESIKKEGDYIIVVSPFNIYVLDNLTLEGTFKSRRLQLSLIKDLPYKLYKLKYQITNFSQVVSSKYKYFIDSSGKVTTWNKKRFYNIKYAKVMHIDRLYNGKYQCFIKGLASPFVLNCTPKYLSYINYKGSAVLFDTHEELPESPRQRIKI